MPIEKALIVEKDPAICELFSHTFHRKHIDSLFATNYKDALAYLDTHQFDLLLCSDDIDLLQEVKHKTPHTSVVLLTTFAQMKRALHGVRQGAFSYLIKPFSEENLEALLHKVEEHSDIVQENLCLRQEVLTHPKDKTNEIIAESSIMKHILADVSKIAQSHASVFISGESGTGKEVIAQAIHYKSFRKEAPFVKVNCAAIPEALIESEFFGHEKGAFTGALNRRIGRFELADKGTLLLDEISEISTNLQAKLLRAIQEQEFERVGGTKPVHVNIRFIATSNRNMKEAIEKKTFREDLYYRLNVVPLNLSPLRERTEDIIPLASYFLERLCSENKKPKKTLSKEAHSLLLSYPWPGNIRELANVIERTVIMHTDSLILASDLGLSGSLPRRLTLEEVEKRHILETLASCLSDEELTAHALGITVQTLRSKMRFHQIPGLS